MDLFAGVKVIENVALISINETLFVQILSFLIFLFIINRILFRPLRQVMGERVTYMEKLREEAQQAETEMTRLTDQLEKEEKSIKKEAFQLRKEMEEDGGEKAAEIFSAARQEIADIKTKAAADVQAQIDKARESLQAEAEKISLGIMENVLNRRLSS